MDLPPIFKNRKFIVPASILALIGLSFLAIMAFDLGGDLFIFTLGSVLNAPLAVLITILAISIYRQMGLGKHPRGMWAGMIFCWGLWAIAESLWMYFSLTGSEVPYPSWADLFWLVGYIPLLAGLISRLRSIPTKPTLVQNILIWLISLLIILGAGYFAIKPSIDYWGEGRLVENLPNLIYPLADLLVAIIILRLFFSFEKGDYGFGWRLIAVGFFLLTTADLVFTYATWEEIYYPDMQANLISRLFVDAPYTLSYFMWLLGVLALGILLRQDKPDIKISTPITIPRYCHILLATAGDDTILKSSANIEHLIESGSIIGKPLAQALPLSITDSRLLLEGLHGIGRVTDLPAQFLHTSGKLLRIKICGMAVKDTKGGYLGSNLLLRVPTEDASPDTCLSQESKSLAEYIMGTTGCDFSTEISRFLLDYHLAYLRELFLLADKEGGATMKASLVEKLKEICAEHKWSLQFDLESGIADANYPLEVLRESLPVLLQAVKDFIILVEDRHTVEQKMLEVHAQIIQPVHEEVARYLKQGAVL